MNHAALIRDLRNAALAFQMRTLEMMLRHNPHSPRRNEVTPGERSEPEQTSNGNTQVTNREPSGNTQGVKG